MMFRVDRLLFVILLLGTAFAVPSAHAAAPYQGLYVIMNPYAPGDINNLQTAAQTPCKAGQQSSVTPFCTSANGVFLRFPWCDFELYHLSNAKNQPYPSCHYIVSYSNGAGSKGTQTTIGDRVSPCAGTYDTCSGSNQSVLATSVRYVTQINTQRAAIGLPPLKLSIGMYAGIGTPQTIFDTLGYVDVPNNNTPSNNPDVTTCYRLPLPWAAQFLTSYLAAMDQLLAYIPTQMPAGANIAIVKVSGITGSDAEIQMPGANQIWATPTDPGPATRGPLLSCNPNLTGAQLWLNAYNALPIAGRNLSQADESATGTMIGHIWGTLLNDKLSTALISIPTTDGDAYPYVACGTTGTSTCQTSFVSGPWSVYYFEYYMHDLFNGGLAYSAAAAAYATVRKDTYSLPVSAVSVNATDLSTQTINTANAEPCVVNNVLPVNDLVDTLNNVKTSVPGVGTVIGWQTSIDQSVYCSSNSYLKILTGGIDQGSLFEEVEEDAAFANLGSCGQYLTQALKDILALSPPTTCVY